MFDKAWKIAILVLGIVGVGLLIWKVWGSDERHMTPLMKQISGEIAQEFGQQLPRERDIDTVLVLVVGRGHRDEEREFSNDLIDVVERSGKYRVKTWSDVEKVFNSNNDYLKTFLKAIGKGPGEEVTDLEHVAKALQFMDRANVVIDGILMIKVTEFTEGPNHDGLGAKITLEADLWLRTPNTTNGKVITTVAPITHGIESALDLRYLSHTMGNMSIFWRYPLWLLLCCGIPWAGIGVVRGVLKTRNNVMNMSLLAGLTVMNLALAWVLILAFGTGGGTVLGLLILAAMMGYYNYDAVDYIERKLL